MKKLFYAIMLPLFAATIVNAQDKTRENLQAEREAIKTERKSEAYTERQKKMSNLKDPGTTGIESIDNLTYSSTNCLLEAIIINEILPELYKRTIGETVDGITEVTVKTPTLNELLEIYDRIETLGENVAVSGKAIEGAKGDIKSAGILKAPQAATSLVYVKNVSKLLVSEIAYQTKIINHLIATLKSSKNL